MRTMAVCCRPSNLGYCVLLLWTAHIPTGGGGPPSPGSGEPSEGPHTTTRRERQSGHSSAWQRFGDSEYLFVLDSEHRLDLSRNDSKKNCQDKGADLVSLETEAELEFIKAQIRRHAKSRGQDELRNEEWWTNGASLRQTHWVWDTGDRPTVQISALKRVTVPRNGPHYLALTHTNNWRLKVVPAIYQLRYVCERERERPTISRQEILQQMEALREELISPPYSAKTSPPGTDPVTLEIAVTQIRENVTDGSLYFRQELSLGWRDERLAWKGRAYPAVHHVNMSAGSIWSPRLSFRLHQGAQSSCASDPKAPSMVVKPLGHVSASRFCDVTLNCSLRHAVAFPFDVMSCQFALCLENSVVPLQVTWNMDSIEGTSLRNTWTVSSVSTSEAAPSVGSNTSLSSPSSVATLVPESRVFLHRDVLYHVLTLLVPCLALALALLVLLWLPHGPALKCVVALCVALAFLLYLGLGGRHRHGHGMTYTDLFMVVLAAINLLAFAVHVYIWTLLRRQRTLQESLAWSATTTTRRPDDNHTQNGGHNNGGRHRPAASAEEKLSMLDDPPLGLTSLGRDAHVTVTPDPYAPSIVGYGRDTSRPPLDKYTRHGAPCNGKNGCSMMHQSEPSPSQRPTNHSAPRGGDADDSMDSGCHSAPKSPDSGLAALRGPPHQAWARWFVWLDRAVATVFSAAVIFTIMIFTILFLST